MVWIRRRWAISPTSQAGSITLPPSGAAECAGCWSACRSRPRSPPPSESNIDAFCTGAHAQVPVLARFGAQPEIIEDAKPLQGGARRASSRSSIPRPSGCSRRRQQHPARPTAARQDAREPRRWLRKTGAVPTRAELEATLVSERTRLLKHAQALYPKASEALARGVLTQKGEWTKRSPPPPELPHSRACAKRSGRSTPCPRRSTTTGMGGLEAILAAAQARRRAAQGVVRRSAARLTSPSRARRARGARLGRRSERPAALARPEDLAHPGRRVPGHLPVQFFFAWKLGFRMDERRWPPRCSSSATRCSPSTASAKPKFPCFYVRNTTGSAPFYSSRSSSAPTPLAGRPGSSGSTPAFRASCPRRKIKPPAPCRISPPRPSSRSSLEPR